MPLYFLLVFRIFFSQFQLVARNSWRESMTAIISCTSSATTCGANVKQPETTLILKKWDLHNVRANVWKMYVWTDVLMRERERKRKRRRKRENRGDRRIAAANNKKKRQIFWIGRMNIRLFILRSVSCDLILSSPAENIVPPGTLLAIQPHRSRPYSKILQLSSRRDIITLSVSSIPFSRVDRRRTVSRSLLGTAGQWNAKRNPESA